MVGKPITRNRFMVTWVCRTMKALRHSVSTQSQRHCVKSGSTPVGGPVKSGRKRTEDEGRGLDKRLVWPELVTAWIQRLRIMSVDPLRRFWSRGVDRDRRRWTRTGVDDYG